MIFGNPLIEKPEIREVARSLESGWLSSGPKVQCFEEMFRRYKASKFAIAVNSCTSALHLSIVAAGIRPKDEVIVPTMTFAATANAVVNARAKPVFVDCRIDTMNLDCMDAEKKITSRTKAIIPVHFAGRPCDMGAVMRLARKHRLKVIEDCAHAIEAESCGRKTGTWGDLGCFSFYVTKNITTGEGGMIITDNSRYEEKLKILAMQGMSKDAWRRFSDSGYKHYRVIEPGFKYNMMDLQAAIGIHQLPRINEYWQRRRRIWQRYDQAFQGLPLKTPLPAEPGTKHAYHLYTVMLDIERLKITRDQFLDKMGRRNIGTGVHYLALHLQPFYRKAFSYKRGDFPCAEWISQRTVSLPISPKLGDSDVDDVIAAVKGILSASTIKKWV